MTRVEARLVSFCLLLSLICAVVIVFRGQNRGRNVLIQDRGVPTFEWSDNNVDMFYKACREGNEAACKDLVSSDDALANLNRRASKTRIYVQPQSSEEESSYDKFRKAGDDVVPLAGHYNVKDMSGYDLGATLSPVEVEQKMVATPGSTMLRAMGVGKLYASRYPLALLVSQGYRQQRGIQRLAVVPASCDPDGPNCGPTRPEEDDMADVPLPPRDWLNMQYECCPCLGQGSRRIGYDQFENSGFYNPYTMNLCHNCGCTV
uniref:Uncharacterized protein n=1 Tax=Hanusia phi TaxID=3032 RepID=A0A7S0EI18_9CRYP